MRVSRDRHGVLIVATLLLVVGLVSPISIPAEAQSPGGFEEVDRYIEEGMNDSSVPGASLAIVGRDQIRYSHGYGETADDEPVTAETLFGIGSTGKSITALATMQLVEAGDIDLDALVRDYMPWFTLADAERTEQLTVRHLLTMTSGIPATAGGEAFRSTQAMSPEEAIRSLATAEFVHEPGSTFEYVNANYVILGHLVGLVSGQSYGEYVQQHIFDPLEMDDTHTELSQARAAGFGGGHRYWFGLPVAYRMDVLPSLVPAGYIVSNADDPSNYLQMYLNGGTYAGREILSPAGVDTLHTGVLAATLGPWADGAEAEYAMGWYVGGPWGDGTTIFHPGSAPNFTAMLMLDQERDLGLVMLMSSSSELPLPGMEGALRELPSGAWSLLAGEQPNHGTGLSRSYLIFDPIVAGFILIQAFALVRLGRQRWNPSQQRSGWKYVLFAAPLLWEIGLGVGLLFLPGLVGMSWRSAWLWMPDLTLAILLIAGLWLLTGTVRVTMLGTAALAGRTRSVGTRIRPAGSKAQAGRV